MLKSSSESIIKNQIPLTTEEMFEIISGRYKGGIIGYEPPKNILIIIK